METNSIEKVNFTKIEQSVMKTIRDHAEGDSELEKDLYKVLDIIKEERNKADKVKALAYELAAKL